MQRQQCRRSSVFIVNFELISHLALVFLLLILSMYLPAGKVISKTRNIIEALDGRGNAFSILFSFFFILFFASQKLKLTCYISLFDFRGNFILGV